MLQPSENARRAARAERSDAALLEVLADGEWHCEATLTQSIGQEPSQVRDQLAALSRWGLQVQSEPDKGFRLSHPLYLLSLERIRAELPDGVSRRTSTLEVALELDSTNAHLLRAPAPAPGCLVATLAEVQHAGRGRRGRSWRMPLGAGISLSVGWTFRETPADLPALSLAAGVVTRRVIEAATGRAPLLKWPNDLVWNDRKLGGILVETAALRRGACHVVVGVGLNVSMNTENLRTVSDWRFGAIDLAGMTVGRPPSRNDLAARLIEGYCELFRRFEIGGFGGYRGAFLEADYLRQRPVVVTDGPNRVSGVATGVDAGGALIVETEAGTRRIVSGDVSVRPGR